MHPVVLLTEKFTLLSAAFTFCHVIWQGHFQRERVTVSYAVNQDLGCHLSHFFNRNMHSCKHWRYILCNFNIVHADDRDIVRNAIASHSWIARIAPIAVMSFMQKKAVTSGRTFQNSFGSLITGFGRAGNISYNIFVKINMIFLSKYYNKLHTGFHFSVSPIYPICVCPCEIRWLTASDATAFPSQMT